MAKHGSGFGIVALGALAVGAYLFSRKGGTGDTTGTIKYIRLEQLGAKGPGAYLGLTVLWTPNTLSYQGLPIPWTYRVLGSLHLDATSNLSLAETVIEEPNRESGTDVETLVSSGSTLQAGISGIFGPFAVPSRSINAYGAQYYLQAKIVIQAAVSDIDGKPTATFQEKDVGISNRLLINQDFSAKPSVTIQGAIVS